MIRVRPESTIPIYEQIVAQVVFAIAAEDWPPGQLLPSVRDLAAELVVNPNTVVRAFQELERLGAIATRRGVGMEVTADGPKLCREHRRELVLVRLREALREASAAGLGLKEISKMVEQEWPKIVDR